MRWTLIILLLLLASSTLGAQTISNEEFQWEQMNQCYCNVLKASSFSDIHGAVGSVIIKSPRKRAVIDLVSSDLIRELNEVLKGNIELSSPKAVIKIELIMGQDLSICVERVGVKELLISNEGYNSLVKLLQSLQLSKAAQHNGRDVNTHDWLYLYVEDTRIVDFLFRLTKVIS